GGGPGVAPGQRTQGWPAGRDWGGPTPTKKRKSLRAADVRGSRHRFSLPIPDAALEAELPPYYHPGENSDEIAYMQERRAALGGYLPPRGGRSKPLTLPREAVYDELKRGPGQQAGGPTQAVVPLPQGPREGPGVGPPVVPRT